jgi:drug/metabolite transporter (DMT)-like permease
MGDTCVHVLFVRLLPQALPLDAISRTFPWVPFEIPSWLLQGVSICIAGLGLLVTADQLTDKDWAALNKGKGDAFMILGATLYGFSTSCLDQLHSACEWD